MYPSPLNIFYLTYTFIQTFNIKRKLRFSAYRILHARIYLSITCTNKTSVLLCGTLYIYNTRCQNYFGHILVMLLQFLNLSCKNVLVLLNFLIIFLEIKVKAVLRDSQAYEE